MVGGLSWIRSTLGLAPAPERCQNRHRDGRIVRKRFTECSSSSIMIAASLSCKVENMTKQWAVAAAVLLLASTIPAGARRQRTRSISGSAGAATTLYSIRGGTRWRASTTIPTTSPAGRPRLRPHRQVPACSGRISDSRRRRQGLHAGAAGAGRRGQAAVAERRGGDAHLARRPADQDEPVSFRESVQSHLTITSGANC